MDSEEDWNLILKDHPILSLPKSVSGPSGKGEVSLELSLNTLPNFTNVDPVDDGPTPSGRRQVMLMKDADMIVAAGSEIRITSLGDSKLQNGPKSFKVLHTPNVTFEIHSMALNPNAKLLAVAGAFQVAVVVLPRPGFTRLVSTTVDCKSIQIGQYYHASQASPPIAKIDWHPWGEGGTTLMVMTADGRLREYDISEDTEEPQQVVSFVPEKKSRSFIAEDASEREVASFTLGTGKADWGPLSIYAIMKSGDIYAICPYMPQNASIPSSYVHALECFVHAKQEYLSQTRLEGPSSSSLSTLYDYQHKYVAALLKQLPPGAGFPSSSRAISMHPPSTIKSSPIRQGPFLLQPSPRDLDSGEDVDASDIMYLAFGGDDDEEGEGETERLGVVLVAFKDGRVDVCLDVEKVEAKWEHRQHAGNDLPMLAVYETIDLGIISLLGKVTSTPSDPPILDLVQGNHPVFLRDPIQDETVYVYHAFGVHALQLGSFLQTLTAALRDDTSNDGSEDILDASLRRSQGTMIQPIVNTFSIERRCSNPVIAVAIPNDVYLTYSIFILTSAMRIVCFPLTLQSDLPNQPVGTSSTDKEGNLLTDSQTSQKLKDEPLAYVSLLSGPFIPPPALSRPHGLPSNPILAVPVSRNAAGEVQLTPDTLRFLGTTYQRITNQISEVNKAMSACTIRAAMQEEEFKRQQKKCGEILETIERLRGERQVATRAKLESVQDAQKELSAKLERVLRSLMKSASPDLSEHETKWFEELRRMKGEVMGIGKYDQESLETRTAMLRREFDRLMPSLKDLREKEERLKRRLSDSNQGLGVSQAFELGERSYAEQARIRNIEEDIVKLADKLNVTLGPRPHIGLETEGNKS